MRWRTLAMTVSVVLLSAMVAFAQGKGRGGGEKGQRGGEANPLKGAKAGARAFGGEGSVVEEILRELNPTDEQKQRFDEIKADFEKKTTGLREKARNAMMELRKFRQDNPDDRQGLRQKAAELMQQNAGPLRDALSGYVEEIKAVLNEEQLKKFNQLLDERGGLAGGLMGRMAAGILGFLGIAPQAADELALTPEQQEKIKALGEACAEEKKKLEEKYAGLVKETLTPEQQAKFDKALEGVKNRPTGPGMMGNGPMGGGRMGGKRLDRGEKPVRPPKDGGAAPNPAPAEEKPVV
jgi:Spy/CpxP family protein refolding chaperone